MKRWTFRFKDNEDDSWGWNSVWARGKKSAANKAIKKLKSCLLYTSPSPRDS